DPQPGRAAGTRNAPAAISTVPLAGKALIALAEFGESLVDLHALPLEMSDLFLDHLRRHGKPRRLVALLRDHFADLDKRKAEALSFEDEFEMLAVLGAVEAGQTFPFRAEQALILIKA